MRPYLLFAICLLLTTLPLYQRASRMFEERELALSGAWLGRGAAALDQQLTVLQQTAQNLAVNADFRKYNLPTYWPPLSDYVPLRRLNDQFRQLISPIGLISDCGLRYPSGLTLTRYRLLIGDGLYGAYLRYEDLEEEGWLALLQSASTSGTLLPARSLVSQDYGAYQGLTWVALVSTYPTSRSVAVLYATINTSAIPNMMMADDLLEDSFLILRRTDGTVLMTYGPYEAADYHRLTARAVQSGLVVEMGISADRFAHQMWPIRQVLLLYIALAAGIALLLALFFAYRSTKPMQKLLQLVQLAPNTAKEGRSNDYDTVANALVGLHQSAEQYRKALETQAQRLRTRVFDRFLQGDWAKQTKDFEQLFPHFPEHFHLAMIRPESSGEEARDVFERRAEKQLLLQELCAQQFDASVYTQLLERSIVLVLPYAQEADTQRYTQLLAAVRTAFSRQGGGRCCIVLSEVFAGYTALGSAYAQAQSLLQQTDPEDRFVDVWRISNFPNRPPAIPLRYEDMILLHKMLDMGNTEAVHDLLDRLRTDIHQSGYLGSVILHQIFYGLRGVLLRVKLENLELLSDLYVPDYRMHSDLTQMLTEFTDCCDRICAQLEANRRQGGRRDFSEQVIRFIQDNVHNSELYAKMVASHFGVSETTLQKIVREATGTSFFDHVEQRRFALAHDLLTGTDLPIAEIAARCGYASSNSFYKAFKRHARMTPSALREAQRNRNP